MHPILFHIGDFAVRGYGAALSLAFAVGIAVTCWRAPARGVSREDVIDVSICIIFSSLAGSRLFYVLGHLDEFRAPRGHWFDAVNPFHGGGDVVLGGLSVMGGLPAALIASTAYLAWKRLPVAAISDLIAPSVGLGAGITRIGCFLNGCCFGTVCPATIGVRFPEGSIPAATFGELPLHASQLYQSAAGFAIAAGLLWFDRRKSFDGAVVLALCIAMGAQRFAAEFVRHSEDALVLARAGAVSITAYQLVALGLVAAGVGLWRPLALRAERRRRTQ